VVASGQFLLDSEASLKGIEARMEAAAPPAAVQTHHGVGKVENIGKDEITISHTPIASLNWPAMTMGFKPPSTGLPGTLRVGDEVSFDIQANEDGSYRIVRIAPATGAAR
jgi:Cu(I)/Ag(I) efflux system membrane fusion protein